MAAGVSGSFRASTAVRAGATDVLLRGGGTVLGAVHRESARKRRAGTQKKPADAMFTSAGAKMCSAVRCETARAAEQG